jgi:hypothetical protein
VSSYLDGVLSFFFFFLFFFLGFQFISSINYMDQLGSAGISNCQLLWLWNVGYSCQPKKIGLGYIIRHNKHDEHLLMYRTQPSIGLYLLLSPSVFHRSSFISTFPYNILLEFESVASFLVDTRVPHVLPSWNWAEPSPEFINHHCFLWFFFQQDFSQAYGALQQLCSW